MKSLLAIAIAISISTLIGCGHAPRSPSLFSKQIPRPDRNHPNCLALSGGGIRSAAVSLGVLQRLNEVDVLKDFQLVSAVSGGSYPIYGILRRYNVHREPLDAILAEGGDYVNFVDESANGFITHATLVRMIALGAIYRLGISIVDPFWQESIALSISYEGDIDKVFGGNATTLSAQLEKSISLQNARPPPRFPYPIFNASASPGVTAPLSAYKYPIEGTFELTPDFIGSPNLGYQTPPPWWITLLNASRISGAAIDAPKLDEEGPAISDSLKRIGITLGSAIDIDEKRIFLSDGGFIDNQGVTSLMRRKCSSILALDATSDDNGSFASWYSLMHSDYIIGSVKNFDLDLHLEELSNKRKNGWNRPHIYNIEYSVGGIRLPITILKLGIDMDNLSSYPPSVERFAKKQWAENWNGTPSCRNTGPLDRRCAFPLEGTGRQTFSKEEFKAYRCLGKYMVQEWLARLSTNPAGSSLPPMKCF